MFAFHSEDDTVASSNNAALSLSLCVTAMAAYQFCLLYAALHELLAVCGGFGLIGAVAAHTHAMPSDSPGCVKCQQIFAVRKLG